LAARFELDANTIAYKDAKTLAVVFKAANERQIELKASDLAMAAFILSMTKVWCKALPAGTQFEIDWAGEPVEGMTHLKTDGALSSPCR